MRMEYLDAEATLAAAEERAWREKDFDTLSRLLLPLQEARRQRRQRCGEGTICLDLIAKGPESPIDAEQIVREIPHGQILIAGWKNTQPAQRARQLQKEKHLYLDVFLASVEPGGVIQIEPDLKLKIEELPRGRQRGTAETYALTMSIWERLHSPSLAAADAEIDPLKKIAGYRGVIEIDYACELAHQKMADVIRRM